MAAVDGASTECVRTPAPRTENGVSTGSTERQQPQADGTGSGEAGDGNKLSIVEGDGHNGLEGVANYDGEQRGREDHSTLLPNGIHSTISEVQAGDHVHCPGPPDGGVQLRHNSRSRARSTSFYLQSHHGLLLKEEMTVEGEKMVVRLGEESIVWESGKAGKGVCMCVRVCTCACVCACVCVAMQCVCCRHDLGGWE